MNSNNPNVSRENPLLGLVSKVAAPRSAQLAKNLATFATGTNPNAQSIARLVNHWHRQTGDGIVFFQGDVSLCFRCGEQIWLNECLATESQAETTSQTAVLIEGVLTRETNFQTNSNSLLERFIKKVESICSEIAVYKSALAFDSTIKLEICDLLDRTIGPDARIAAHSLTAPKYETDSSLGIIKFGTLKAVVAELVAKYDKEYVVFKNPLLHAGYIAHDLAVREVVNEDCRPHSAVYGGAGADIINFLLSTNAADGYFVGGTDLKYDALENCISELNRGSPDHPGIQENSYAGRKYLMGYGSVRQFDKDDLHEKVACELRALDRITPILGDVRLSRTPGGWARITFDWRYPGVAGSATYAITFFTGSSIDLLDKTTYPQELNQVFDQGFDTYYQRAGLNIPDGYHALAPRIGGALNSNGYMITDDYSILPNVPGVKLRDPDDVLSGVGFVFSGHDEEVTPLMRAAEDLIPRNDETMESRLSRYGWDLRLRRKSPA